MYALIAALVGAALGWFRATKAKGNTLDKLQFAAVFAIIFFLIGMGLTILADWQGWV